MDSAVTSSGTLGVPSPDTGSHPAAALKPCAQPAHVNDSHCEEGVVSRDGWAVVDDSAGPRWDTHDSARAEWPWVTGVHAPPATPGSMKPSTVMPDATAPVLETLTA